MPADPALSPPEWEQLQALFATACELPDEARAAFVAQAPGGEAIRRHLAGMLAGDASAQARLAQVVGDAASAPASADLWIGRRFGPYRVTREIGRGGMGVVLEGVRDDYHKRVAIKIAPWSRDAALLRERFRLEGQILAALEHPHIARFLDAGTEGEVPFVVMEYVEGRPITAFADQHRLDLRARLELFRKVCGAVHAAHEHLIVHRDLKPANILVDAEGAPRLLDFGIAKLLDPVARGDLTAGVGMWTPDYTSPEQVRNGAVSVRTDVYSLGLILYELLTGARAQIADTSSALALDRSICETEPARPSDRVAAAGDRVTARRLRGDLDTIVTMAIRKEPERRYASASALSDDIGRYLDARPVLARPSTALYRVGKLVRRHRVATAAALLLAASAAAGVTATIYQARRAEYRFRQVRSLANAVVFDVHDRIAKLPGSTEARQALVRTALTYLENLKDDAASDEALSAELAAAYEKIANVQGNPLSPNLGDMQGAVSSFRRAEELLTPIAAKGNGEVQLRLAAVAHGRGLVHRALGDVKEATSAYAQSREIGERLLAETPDHREALTLMGTVYADISQAARDLRDKTAAAEAADRAVATVRRLVDLDPQSRDHRTALASAYSAAAGVAAEAPRLEEAAANYRIAIDIREHLMREDPNTLTYRRNLIVGYGNLADILGARLGSNLGDVPGAETALTRASELAEWIHSRDPADRRAMFDLANVKYRYGTLLIGEDGRAGDGLRVLQEAAALNDKLLAEEPDSNRYAFLALLLDRRIGEALTLLGRRADAARMFERVRASGPKLVKGPNAPAVRLQMALVAVKLAALQAEAGDARASATTALALNEMTSKPPDVPQVDAEAYATLGRAYLALANSDRTGARDAHRAAATANLTKSAELWKQAQVPASRESRRATALEQIAADLTSLQGR
jgi:tetratricopeptide (TPR) repeat protein